MSLLCFSAAAVLAWSVSSAAAETVTNGNTLGPGFISVHTWFEDGMTVTALGALFSRHFDIDTSAAAIGGSADNNVAVINRGNGGEQFGFFNLLSADIRGSIVDQTHTTPPAAFQAAGTRSARFTTHTTEFTSLLGWNPISSLTFSVSFGITDHSGPGVPYLNLGFDNVRFEAAAHPDQSRPLYRCSSPVETPLTAEAAREKLMECMKMSRAVRDPYRRIIFEDMAETWDRIVRQIESRK
jgi:hypothetical protein